MDTKNATNTTMVATSAGDPPCCPELAKEPCCDVLDFRYRLPHRVTVNDQAGRPVSVTVEVTPD